MKTYKTLNLIVALSLLLAMGLQPVLAQEKAVPMMATPDEIDWKAAPAEADGRQSVVLSGDPNKPGLYTVRMKLPGNIKLQPHWHSDERMVVIISGTFHYAYGEKFDETKLKTLPPGSTFTEPANQPHFAWSKSGEIILQFTGFGPTVTTMVDRK